MNLREEQILLELKKGNKSALEKIYKEYYIALCTYAIDLIGDTAAGQDIVSDFYCFVWEHRNQLKIKDSLRSYLFISIRNRCFNHLKHKKAVQKFKSESTYFNSRIDELNRDFIRNSDDVQDLNIYERINEAIENLPDQAKKIFKLKRQQGFSYEEISNQLNISVNTIRKQMSRALSKLRNSLSDLNSNPKY